MSFLKFLTFTYKIGTIISCQLIYHSVCIWAVDENWSTWRNYKRLHAERVKRAPKIRIEPGSPGAVEAAAALLADSAHMVQKGQHVVWTENKIASMCE